MNKNTDNEGLPDIESLNAEIRDSIRTFSGKWKLEILWLLSQRTHRFNELRRSLPGITQHMLTAQLRELEHDAMVTRVIYAEMPPRVEYSISDKARGLAPVFRAIFAWARADGRQIDPGRHWPVC
jgi:Predicted transcriptional regulators